MVQFPPKTVADARLACQTGDSESELTVVHLGLAYFGGRRGTLPPYRVRIGDPQEPAAGLLWQVRAVQRLNGGL